MAKSKAQQEIDKLANFIMNDIPGEPSRSEGAVDTIIRLYRESQMKIDAGGRFIDSIERAVSKRSRFTY